MSLQQFNVGLYVGLEHFRFTATLIILVVSLIIRQSTLQRKNSAPKHCFKYRTNRYKHLHGTKLSLKATWPRTLSFYETQAFIIVFTRTCSWIMSTVRHIQPTSLHPVSFRHVLIIFSHPYPGHSRSYFPFRFSD